MVEYAERLNKAMEDAGMSVSALAAAMKLSYQAIKKVVDGRTNAFTAANNDAAARILGVSPSWLATGRGPSAPTNPDQPMQPSPPLPTAPASSATEPSA